MRLLRDSSGFIQSYRSGAGAHPDSHRALCPGGARGNGTLRRIGFRAFVIRRVPPVLTDQKISASGPGLSPVHHAQPGPGGTHPGTCEVQRAIPRTGFVRVQANGTQAELAQSRTGSDSCTSPWPGWPWAPRWTLAHPGSSLGLSHFWLLQYC